MGDGRSKTDRTAPVTAAGGEALRVRRVRLEVIAGRDRGASHTSSGPRTVIGTDRSASFVLTDPTVSRFHCEIDVTTGKAVMRDLGSRNGSCVGGASVREAELSGDVRLTLGKTQLAVRIGDEALDVTLSPRDTFGTMVGRAPAIRAAFSVLERAAQTQATVLLQGETGTGKDAAAESIHREGARSGGPFVPVDCGAIPPGLLESELFGVERGAFTGADTSRPGAFQEASGGTLLLDEIGELGRDLQPKLLRALETRTVRPVGRGKATRVDVRVIAATNRDLRADVASGAFRPDLYYRLAVVEVRLPPLRERLEDIPLLVEQMLTTLAAMDHPAAGELVARARSGQLANHAWPGNVRELRNYVERCLTLDGMAPLPTEMTAAEPLFDTSEPLHVARERYVRDFERRYLEQLLREHDDNVAAAARAAGIHRVHLHRLLARAGLR